MSGMEESIEPVSTPEPQESESDFKLIKKYARKCNLQNKYLQNMLSVVVEELNHGGSTLDIDLNCVSEANVESFLSYWSEYSAARKISAATERNLQDQVAELEQTCREYEDAKNNATVAVVPSDGETIAVEAGNVNAAQAIDAMPQDPIGAISDNDAPVKSVRLSLDKGVLINAASDRLNGATANEGGGGSRCQSREGRNSTGSVLLDDVMLACETEEAREPPPEIKGKSADSGDSGAGVGPMIQPVPERFDSTENTGDHQLPESTKSRDSVNPFDDDELDQFEQSTAGANAAPSTLPASVVDNTTAVSDTTAGDRKESNPPLASTALPAPISEASNPFDSSDDEDTTPAIASNIVNSESMRNGEREDDGSDGESTNKTDPYCSTEWTLYTEDHACPPYGLNSPVVDHLLLSWTTDQRKIHYLISWIECLSSPLPEKFPSGLQIVKVSDVVRDGFLILLLPLVRDISMHEVRAYARLSAYETSQTTQARTDPKDEKEKSYDVRFEVIRKPSSDKGSSAPIPTESMLTTAPPRGGSADIVDVSPVVPVISSETAVETSKPVPATAVWQSSLTSLLSPISSFWPVSSPTPALVTKEADSSSHADKPSDTKIEINNSHELNPEQESTEKPEEATVPYEFTTSASLKSIPLSRSTADASSAESKDSPVLSTNKKPKGAPSSGRIAERLAALRSNQK